jgi:hypothetical protein
MPRKDDTVQVLDEDIETQGDYDLDGDPNLTEDEAYDGTQELRVDISEQEATSEARVFTPIPGGAYTFYITDGSVKKCGPSSKNPGKPYFALELTVADGEYQGRKQFTNVMLFKGALYTWAQLAKALGLPADGVVPPLSRIVGTGEKIGGVVAKVVDKWKIEQEGWTPDSGEPRPMKNEIKGFMPAGRVGTKLASTMPNHGGRVLPNKPKADDDLE